MNADLPHADQPWIALLDRVVGRAATREAAQLLADAAYKGGVAIVLHLHVGTRYRRHDDGAWWPFPEASSAERKRVAAELEQIENPPPLRRYRADIDG